MAPVCVRTSPAQRRAWQAGLEPGETLSELIHCAVERELERRREARELEEKRRAEVAANPLARFDVLLEQARRSAAVSLREAPAREPCGFPVLVCGRSHTGTTRRR